MPAAGSTTPHSFTLLSTARFKIVYFLILFVYSFLLTIFVVIFALCYVLVKNCEQKIIFSSLFNKVSGKH